MLANCKGCKKLRERSEYLRDPATFARIQFEQRNTKILQNSLRAWEEEQGASANANSCGQRRCKRSKSQPRRRHSSCNTGYSSCCPNVTQEFNYENQFDCFDRMCEQTRENEQYNREPEDDSAYVIEYCNPSFCIDDNDHDRDGESSNCSNSDNDMNVSCTKPRKSRSKKRKRSRK